MCVCVCVCEYIMPLYSLLFNVFFFVKIHIRVYIAIAFSIDNTHTQTHSAIAFFRHKYLMKMNFHHSLLILIQADLFRWDFRWMNDCRVCVWNGGRSNHGPRFFIQFVFIFIIIMMITKLTCIIIFIIVSGSFILFTRFFSIDEKW